MAPEGQPVDLLTLSPCFLRPLYHMDKLDLGTGPSCGRYGKWAIEQVDGGYRNPSNL